MQTIEVILENGETREYPYGTTAANIFEKGMSSRDENPIIAALVNNTLTSLSYKVEINARVNPVRLYSHYGNRIYRRSLSFLLAMASREVFPDRHLIIGHSLGDAFYYYYEGMASVTDEEVEALEKKMLEISERALPITRRVLSYEQTLEYLEKAGLNATLQLLHYRNDPKIPVYTCDGFIDLSYEPLVQNTNLLNLFKLRNYAPGFLLRFPQAKTPDRVDEFQDNPVLFSIYTEYKAWGKILNVNCTGRLNRLIEQREIQYFLSLIHI